jgi:hypothetical protein
MNDPAWSPFPLVAGAIINGPDLIEIITVGELTFRHFPDGVAIFIWKMNASGTTKAT